MSRKKMSLKIGDIILCAFILLIAALLFFVSLTDKKGTTVVIAYGGEESAYDLFQDREIEIASQGYTLKVRISDGRVSVIEADCPDKICKASGEISSPPHMIACVPAGVTIKVEGKSDEKIDWIAP